VLPTGATLASIGQLAIKRAGRALEGLRREDGHAVDDLPARDHANRVPRRTHPARRDHRCPSATPRNPRRAQGAARRDTDPCRSHRDLERGTSAVPTAIALGVAGLRVGEVLGMTADRYGRRRAAARHGRPPASTDRERRRAHDAEVGEASDDPGAVARGAGAPPSSLRAPGRRPPIPWWPRSRDATLLFLHSVATCARRCRPPGRRPSCSTRSGTSA